MKADDTDKKIIEILKQNSRSTNVEIAKSIGLTEGAVRHRINSLVRTRAIKRFTVELSPANEVFAIVMVKARTGTKKMMADIASIGVAKEAYEITGEYDGCIIVEAGSLEDADKKIDRMRELGTVADTRTFISVKRW